MLLLTSFRSVRRGFVYLSEVRGRHAHTQAGLRTPRRYEHPAFSLSIVERGFDVRLERLYCSRDAFYTKFVSGPQGRDETERGGLDVRMR